MTVLDFGDSRAYTKLRPSDRIWRTRSSNVNSEKVPDQQLECNQEAQCGHFRRGKTSNTPSTSVDAGDPCHARPQRPVIVRNQQGNRIEVRWTYALILACITQTFRQFGRERSDAGHASIALS